MLKNVEGLVLAVLEAQAEKRFELGASPRQLLPGRMSKQESLAALAAVLKWIEQKANRKRKKHMFWESCSPPS